MSENSADSVLYSNAFHEVLGEDVLQVLKCGICLEFYENPVVLPCGHTFCYNCLLQMGKHANRNKNFVPVHDLTIGCPNCRCPIFVIALLKRDVTLNYPIQSLIDGLKARPDVKPKKFDASTNTDPEPEPVHQVNKKERNPPIPPISNLEFEKITKEIDRFAVALHGSSIISDAFFSIEKIRNDYLESDKIGKNNVKTNPDAKNKLSQYVANISCATGKRENKDNLFFMSNFQSKLPQADVGFDPAIVSYSMGGSGFNVSQPENPSIY